MKKLILDTERIRQELVKFEKKKSWISKKLNISRQMLAYYYSQKPVKAAEQIAPLFNLDPKDLIITIDVSE